MTSTDGGQFVAMSTTPSLTAPISFDRQESLPADD